MARTLSVAAASRAKHVATVAVLVLLAACSADEPVAGNPDAAAPADAAVATATPPTLDLCTLMPMADVSAILQAHGVDAVNTQEPGSGGMCAYRTELEPRGYSTKLLIDFTAFPSADQAQEQMQAMQEEYQRRSIATQPVPDLGDAAVVLSNAGRASVRIRVGAYSGQINLSMGERDPASLQPAVLALGREVVARLPKQ
jgi:hypothetical protein